MLIKKATFAVLTVLLVCCENGMADQISVDKRHYEILLDTLSANQKAFSKILLENKDKFSIDVYPSYVRNTVLLLSAKARDTQNEYISQRRICELQLGFQEIQGSYNQHMDNYSEDERYMFEASFVQINGVISALKMECSEDELNRTDPARMLEDYRRSLQRGDNN
jgi:hypothetical protein